MVLEVDGDAGASQDASVGSVNQNIVLMISIIKYLMFSLLCIHGSTLEMTVGITWHLVTSSL